MSGTPKILENVTPDSIPWETLFASPEPILLKGLVKDWPLVKKGQQSFQAMKAELTRFYDQKPILYFRGGPDMGGCFSYNEDMSGFNYDGVNDKLTNVLDLIEACQGQAEHDYFYMNSLVVDQSFPGMRGENDLVFNHPVFEKSPFVAKIWIGTESRALAHYDIPQNLACCVMGKRRFTLFPPSQIKNIYPGPWGMTPGGQPVTMADIKNPDIARFPGLEEALANAVVVDMEPGDAVYYPSLWWHEVDALSTFNVMVNYWWVNAPRFMGNPTDLLMHGILSLRDRSPAEKQAWREFFDYYVFGDAELPRQHLPDSVHGVLAPMDDHTSRRLRNMVKQGLNI